MIRGVSDRRAWILDFRVTQNEAFTRFDPAAPSAPDEEFSNNGWSIYAGPRRRSYTRAIGDLSPYWDLFLDGSYGRGHGFVGGSSRDLRQIGANLGSDVGIEYFTPWGLSVAAHSRLVQFTWNHIRDENASAFGGTVTGHTQSLSVGITPGLYVRLYF